MRKKAISIFLCTALFMQLLLTVSPVKSAHANEPLSFMYLYGGDIGTYQKQIEQTKGAINTISPNFFTLNTKGQLITTVDQELVKYAHRKGLKIVPFLSNHWNREIGQKALANYQQLAKNLANAITKYDLDGINIDLENITSNDKGNLNRLVDELQKLLPPDKTVSVAVAAVQKHTTIGWQGAYDLAYLGKVADYLIIMGYDEHWDGGEPGPVASLPWVKNTLNYMTTQVPTNKLVLGVPFYGRVWTNGKNGQGVTYATAIKQVEKYGTSIKWHEAYQAPYLKYTTSSGDKKELWFENKSSIHAKVDLVNQYNLKGVAAWRLGQEDTSIWSDFKRWLKPNVSSPFVDTKNHWAENEIRFMKEQGYIKGEPGQQFNPDKPISRAEAVAILSRITGWNTLTTGTPFKDVDNHHWAIEPILAAYNHGILTNFVRDNQFSPASPLKRGEAASLVQRSLNIKTTNTPEIVFYDVPNNHWTKNAIYTMVKNSFMDPVDSHQFGLDHAISKAEFCAILTRILQ